MQVAFFFLKDKFRLERWTANDGLLGCSGLRRQKRGHLANHRENEAIIAFGKSCAVFLNFSEEANFVLGKFAEHFLCFLVARRFSSREKVCQRNFHGFGNLGECLEGRDGVAILDAREIAADQAGAALDVALGKASLAAIGFDDFADVHLWFLFRHGFLPMKEYLSG